MVANRIRIIDAPRRGAVGRADEVPDIDRDEAAAITTVELSRLLELIRSLATEEWFRPTVNPGWTVREVVAHLCGVVALYAHWGEGARQMLGARRHRDQGPLDAANAAQIDARRHFTPAELTDALATDGPRMIRFRQLVPTPVRRVPMVLPIAGIRPSRYFWDVIGSRELWIHRLDIARAAGHDPIITADHDGRLVALILRDLAGSLPRQLGADLTIHFDLTGPAGGSWDVGPGEVPDATVRLDAIDFAWLTSGRTTPGDLEQADALEIEGNEAIGRRALVLSRVLA